MFRRRTAIAVAPLIAALAVAVAAPASASPGQGNNHRSLMRTAAKINTSGVGGAYGTCSLVVPAKVKVQENFFAVPVRTTGGCTLHPGLKAIWYVGQDLPSSNEGVLFENTYRSDWLVIGSTFGDSYETISPTPLGTRTWRGFAAVDAQNHSYTQNAPQTTLKVASYAGLSASRANGRTTLNTRTVRYATSLDRNIAYAGETGAIQYRPVGGSAWTGLKNVVTNSRGAYSYTYSTSQTREYRVVYDEQAYIWGTTSPTRTS
ncbi:MAG: hypothetical protein ABI360_01025 [Allobranchiibius sp.]